MLFNSYIFIFAFFPLCLAGYFILNHFKLYKLAMIFLFGMSLWFYGYNNIYYLPVILSSILINYSAYLLFSSKLRINNIKSANVIATIGVIINLLILMYFKYMDFFIGNINAVFKSDIPFLQIALPLGISFFTFQQISFIVDAKRGEVKPTSFWEYACFVSFFPQLIAGPIVSHDEILPQFASEEKKHFNLKNFTEGFYIFVLGLAKKTLLADKFSSAVAYGYTTLDRQNSLGAWIIMLSYTIQIYFDFSGYCDMAIGIGRMMNIDIPLNFNSPYKATSVTEFWKRWHITLTRFFTKYIYIPLGGSRKGTVRTCINVFIVFLASGFWHGAAWNFVLWGVMHGTLMVFERLTKKVYSKIPKFITWIPTFLFINIAWTFFRAPSMGIACELIRKAFSFNFTGFDTVLSDTFRIIEIKTFLGYLHIEDIFPHIIMVGFFFVASWFMFFGKNAFERMNRFKPKFINLCTTLILLLWSVLSLSGIKEFLYFNF